MTEQEKYDSLEKAENIEDLWWLVPVDTLEDLPATANEQDIRYVYSVDNPVIFSNGKWKKYPVIKTSIDPFVSLNSKVDRLLAEVDYLKKYIVKHT